MSDGDATKYCVIGAGSSGLAVCRNLAAAGLDFDCFEREDDVGGNWYYGCPHSSIYESTRLISSKPLTEYPDFPMPADYPDYPHHRQVWEYLRAYARHFGLYERITFGTSIERVEPEGDGWRVTLGDGSSRRYRGVVIANGHNWDPRWPEFPGSFSGVALHSAEYKTPEVLRGRRVLVVGGGNSGCDLAVESALHARETLISLRRGYHYLPKYVAGEPSDQVGERFLRWHVPLVVRRAVATVLLRLVVGRLERFGLPKPDHRLFETHPIINSQLLYYVGHGAVKLKPDVAELCGDRVRFADGSEEPIDVILYATGFRISFPFIDQQLLNWRDGRPELFMNVFHPTHDTLAVCGLIQPDSGQFGLVHYQAELIARFFATLEREPANAEWFRRLKAEPANDLGGGIRYVRSPRHLVEIEHFSYRKRLQKLSRRFGLPAGQKSISSRSVQR